MPEAEKEEPTPFRPAPFFHLPLRANAGDVLRDILRALSSTWERRKVPPQREEDAVVVSGGQECCIL